jgi:hypothetical protein
MSDKSTQSSSSCSGSNFLMQCFMLIWFCSMQTLIWVTSRWMESIESRVENIGEHSIRGWRSRVWGWSSSRIRLNWWNVRKFFFPMTLISQLGIKFQYCVLAKGILGFLLGLEVWNIWNNRHVDLQHTKGRPLWCSSLISSIMSTMCLQR